MISLNSHRWMVSQRVLVLLLALFCQISPLAQETNEETKKGSYSGAKVTVHPAWFKESFLELEEDIAEAAQQNKRLMLFFDQDGCPYCNKLIEDNFTRPHIEKNVRSNFEVVAINLWGDRDVIQVGGKSFSEKTLAQALRVNFTPTLLFFDERKQVVLRLNGYYPPDKFEIALNYVSTHQENITTFSDYMAQNWNRTDSDINASISLRDWSLLPPYHLDNLTNSKPLAVIFEEPNCDNCDLLYNKTFKDPQAADLLAQFNLVQLNRWADIALTTPSGTQVTAAEWATALDVGYLPTIVFFDAAGLEVMQADSQLRTFHMLSVFDYVAHQQYKDSEGFQRFLSKRSDRLREQGIDVDIWKY